jgi:hypothetical protein
MATGERKTLQRARKGQIMAVLNPKTYTNWQAFKRDLETLAEAPKDSFQFRATCAECGHIWGTHRGLLCPSRSPDEAFRLHLMGYPQEFVFLPRGTTFEPLQALDFDENLRLTNEQLNQLKKIRMS